MSATVTTIIPTYKRPGLLARAITSAARQTFPDVRICVYDNASRDETADTVRALARIDPRISYSCHETNIGVLQNFEFGLRSVATPYFSFLSDDDFLLPGFYERALAEFSRYPAAAFVVGGTLEHLVQGDVITSGRTARFHAGYHQAPHGLHLFLQQSAPLWTGILFRREVIDIVGGLDPSLILADEDFLLRCASRCGFSLFHEPVAVFRCVEDSISKSFDVDAESRHYSVLTPKVAEFAGRVEPGGVNLIPMWNRAVHQRVARGSLRDIAHGYRDRIAGRLEIMATHPSSGSLALSLRIFLAVTSARPVFRMASLVARGIRRTKFEIARARNRMLTSRYRPVIDLLENATAQALAGAPEIPGSHAEPCQPEKASR